MDGSEGRGHTAGFRSNASKAHQRMPPCQPSPVRQGFESNGGREEAVHEHVGVSPDGGGEVGVEGHGEAVVIKFGA